MSIAHNARLIDFVHAETGNFFTGDKFASDIKIFREEISRIFRTFEKCGVACHGTMLVLLNWQYGIMSFRHIEYGKIDEMILWVKNNSNNYLNILSDKDQKAKEYYQKHQAKKV